VDTLGITPPVHSQLWQSVLHQLRVAIVTGALPPGTHLVEIELATRLAVSRGPVREALTRLENEGLVVNYPYRGRFVADITVEDIREIYDLRRLIEGRAVESLGQRVDPEGIKRLREIREQMVLALNEGRNEDFADLDIDFHRQIMIMSKRERLLKIWNTLSSVSHAFIVFNAHNDPEAIARIAGPHDAILDALVQHDTVAAREALIQHLIKAESELIGAKENAERAQETAG
jgi:DNA-binding GntR family transcriptional regulator